MVRAFGFAHNRLRSTENEMNRSGPESSRICCLLMGTAPLDFKPAPRTLLLAFDLGDLVDANDSEQGGDQAVSPEYPYRLASRRQVRQRI